MIFLNYSVTHKDLTVKLCDFLESAGYRCWYANRDILAGDNYMAKIVEAIKASSLMIFLLSEKSCQSQFVIREVELAYTHAIPIIPLRLENFTPTGVIEHSISESQWFDMWEKHFEEYFPQIISAIERHLAVEERKQKDIPPSIPEPQTVSVGSHPVGPIESKVKESPLPLEEEKIEKISRSIMRKLIEKGRPEHLQYFESDWERFWNLIQNMKNRGGLNLCDKKLLLLIVNELSSMLYPYNEREIYAILTGGIVTRLINDLIHSDGKQNKKKLIQIAKGLANEVKMEAFGSFIPDIVEFVLKAYKELYIEGETVIRASPFEPKAERLPPPKQQEEEEEKKEYKVYSHEFPKGKSISSNEFKPLKDEYEPNNDKYLFFIYYDKDKRKFYNVGNPINISKTCIKFLKLLITKSNDFVLLKPLFESISDLKLLDDDLKDKQKNLIHATKSRLMKATLDKLEKYIDCEPNYGYKFKFESGVKFFLIEDFTPPE